MAVEIDYMEYSTDALAQAAYVTNGTFRSNADIDDEDMAVITDWSDTDQDTGVSSQVTFDGKSCLKLESGTGATFAYAGRSQDIGSFGARTVVSINLYFDSIGTLAGNDMLQFVICNGTKRCDFRFASDGLYVYTSSAFAEIGTDLVTQDAWHEWTFDLNWSAYTFNTYIDKALTVSGSAFGQNDASANGLTYFAQYGLSRTVTRISYVDWFKAGSAFAGGLESYSEASIKNQGDYSLKGIAAITDSLNKTLTKTF